MVGCQPDKTIIVEQKPQPAGSDQDCHHSEKATMSEKQFMRDHSLYSAMSSWLFAIAGATNIGLLSVLAAKVLTAVEQGKPIFKSKDPAVPAVMGNKKYNRIVVGMMAFGGACMAVSNWLESKKVVTEWQLGAGKLQRKAHIAENEAENQAADDAPQSRNWTQSVEKKSEPGLEYRSL